MLVFSSWPHLLMPTHKPFPSLSLVTGFTVDHAPSHKIGDSLSEKFLIFAILACPTSPSLFHGLPLTSNHLKWQGRALWTMCSVNSSCWHWWPCLPPQRPKAWMADGAQRPPLLESLFPTHPIPPIPDPRAKPTEAGIHHSIIRWLKYLV